MPDNVSRKAELVVFEIRLEYLGSPNLVRATSEPLLSVTKSSLERSQED